MTNNKKELLTINLETWTEMVREDERKSIEIANLKNILRILDDELNSQFSQMIDEDEIDEEDEVDEEATLKMCEEEQANE